MFTLAALRPVTNSSLAAVFPRTLDPHNPLLKILAASPRLSELLVHCDRAVRGTLECGGLTPLSIGTERQRRIESSEIMHREPAVGECEPNSRNPQIQSGVEPPHSIALRATVPGNFESSFNLGLEGSL